MRQTEKVALVNGRVHTPTGIVSSLTFESGRIVETGVLPDERFHNDMRVIDLHGRTVLPGFCDANARFLHWAAGQERAREGGRALDESHPSDEDLSYLLRTYAPKAASLGLTELCSDDLALFDNDFRRAQRFFMAAASDEGTEAPGLPFRLRAQMRFPDAGALSDFLAEGWRSGDGVPLYQVGAVICHANPEQEDLVLAAHLSGMQLVIEAAWEGAPEGALILLERAQGQRNVNSRHAVRAHAVDEAQIERMKKLRAGAVINPAAAGPWVEMARKGVVLAAGSDGELLSPMAGIQALVTRDPAERLSIAEAIGACTWNAAWNGRNERRRGELAPGQDADLVVLEQDPFSVNPMELAGVEVVLTVCGGRVTWDAGKLD